MANKFQKTIVKFKDDDFINRFKHSLLITGKVKIVGFGIFEIRTVKGHTGFNVGTGKMGKRQSYNKIGFSPAKKLRDASQFYEN